MQSFITTPYTFDISSVGILQAAATYKMAHDDYARIKDVPDYSPSIKAEREARMNAAKGALLGGALAATLDSSHGLVAAHSYALVSGSRADYTEEWRDAEGLLRSKTWIWPPADL